MKIRNGFVSNSSSSSYLILGWRNISPDHNKLIEYFKEDIKECLEPGEDINDTDFILNEVINEIDLIIAEKYLYNKNNLFGITLGSGSNVPDKNMLEKLETLGKFVGINEEPKLYIHTTSTY